MIIQLNYLDLASHGRARNEIKHIWSRAQQLVPAVSAVISGLLCRGDRGGEETVICREAQLRGERELLRRVSRVVAQRATRRDERKRTFHAE